MPDKKRRAPDEKKRLSRQKDRRNTYGENDKAARKAIPLRKAKANRSLRRGVKAALDKGDEEVEGLAKALDRARWRKVPDQPLGDILRTGKQKHEQSYRAKHKRRAQIQGAQIHRAQIHRAERDDL